MNKIDYSFTGGLPMDEEGLNFMQQAYLDGFRGMFADAGNTPVILAGMVRDASTVLTISAGYFYYAGEIYSFPGVALGSGPVLPQVACVNIVPVPAAVIFEDGATHDVYYTGVSSINFSVPDAVNLDYATFKLWQQIFGDVARSAGSPFTTMTVASGLLSGTISYKKNVLTNTLHIKADLTVTVAGSSPNNPPLYYDAIGLGFAALPVDCRPSSTVPLKALLRYHNLTITESTGLDYIRDINCELKTNGGFGFGLLRPAVIGSYGVSFNQIIPLD